jgi:AcrR family transcriptional regulator
VLGWLTFEDFAIAATGLGRTSPYQRDRAVGEAVDLLLGLSDAETPVWGRGRTRRSPTGPHESRPHPRDALVDAAVELFAARGPAAVSVRDVARRADVNPGLVHRHFGSKDALLAAAIERGSTPVLPAALDTRGFDVAGVTRVVHQQTAVARLIARTIVDGRDITSVRDRFPVLQRRLAEYGRLPRRTGPPGIDDPRTAVALAAALGLGSALWEPHLRSALGIATTVDVVPAVTALVDRLLALPTRS